MFRIDGSFISNLPKGVFGTLACRRGSGTWRVIAQNGEPILQLNYYKRKVASYTLSSNEKGRTYLDGDRYLRTCDANDQVVEARPNCW